MPLRELLPLGEQQAALHGAHAVEKQDAVEVVDLVLHRPGLEAGDGDAVRLRVSIQRLEHDRVRAVHFGVHVGDRQAALLGAFDFTAGFHDARIDEHEGRPELLAYVDHGDSLRHADLIRRQTDAVRRPHGFEQVVHQLPDSVVRRRDRLARSRSTGEPSRWRLRTVRPASRRPRSTG